MESPCPAAAEVTTRTRPYPDTTPIGAYASPVVALVVLGLIAYGVYDAIGMFLRYRERRKDDQQLFP